MSKNLILREHVSVIEKPIPQIMPDRSSRILHSSTLQLLRIHFSFFLMPVFWFALSQLVFISSIRSVFVFIILHLLVYPASNGYNSYMDRDTQSIGGIKNPLQPTQQLLYATILLDILAIGLSTFISGYFTAGIIAYILASKAYSYRGIRLKQYPIAGYLTVVIFQGAFTFALVYHACSINKTLDIPLLPMIVASLLIGGFYPLTQIYQHEADVKDGVKSLSYILGYRGTFLYCGIVYALAFALLAFYFFYSLKSDAFYIFTLGMSPVVLYFLVWAFNVWHNSSKANYVNTMRMNIVASVCSNITFITIFLRNYFE